MAALNSSSRHRQRALALGLVALGLGVLGLVVPGLVVLGLVVLEERWMGQGSDL